MVIGAPGPIARQSAATFHPSEDTTLPQTQVFEVAFGKAIDAATAGTGNITLVDLTTGLAYTPTITVETSGTDSRIIIKPEYVLELGHQVRVTGSTDVLYTDGDAAPFEGTWTVIDESRPTILYDEPEFDVLKARVAASTQPWARGWDDSGLGFDHFLLGVKNATFEVGADEFVANHGPSGFTGNPTNYTAAMAVKRTWDRQSDGAFACALAYHFSGSHSTYSNVVGGTLLDWANNWDWAPGYTSGNQGTWPANIMWWGMNWMKMILSADLLWGVTASNWGDIEKNDFYNTMYAWCNTVNTGLSAAWDNKRSGDGPTNISQWRNTFFYVAGQFLGDREIKSWAYNGSLLPTNWTATDRNMKNIEDSMWLGDGSYIDEDRRENEGSSKDGKGWSYGAFACKAMMMAYVVRTHEGLYDSSFNHTNVSGDSLEDHLRYYMNFADGTTAWSDKYPGHAISPTRKFFSNTAFLQGGHFYLASGMRNMVNQDFGVFGDGNTTYMLKEPWGWENIWHVGGNLAHHALITATDGGAHTPADPTGLARTVSGATFANLTWTRSSVVHEGDIPKYYEIVDENGSTLLGQVRENQFVTKDLDPATTYTIRVKATNYQGTSSTGALISFTTDTVA